MRSSSAWRKKQGLKFTFGSDTRDQKAGRLDFCKYVAKKCNLKKDDFFVPKRALNHTLAAIAPDVLPPPRRRFIG